MCVCVRVYVYIYSKCTRRTAIFIAHYVNHNILFTLQYSGHNKLEMYILRGICKNNMIYSVDETFSIIRIVKSSMIGQLCAMRYITAKYIFIQMFLLHV